MSQKLTLIEELTTRFYVAAVTTSRNTMAEVNLYKRAREDAERLIRHLNDDRPVGFAELRTGLETDEEDDEEDED